MLHTPGRPNDMLKLIELLITLFILIAAGLFVKKSGMVTEEGQKNITNLVIYIVLPCNIITAFAGTDASSLKECLSVLLISIFIQIFAVAYGKYAYRNIPDAQARCLRYGIICSNAGFLGNPLAEGLFGAHGLMLASVYLIPQRIMMWSEGIRIFSGSSDSKNVMKKTLTHPCIVACVLGILMMVFNITLPSMVLTPVSTIGRCNTMLSMLVIGMILADIDPASMLDRRVIRFTVERLILFPALVLAGCRLAHMDSLVTGLSVLLCAMPAGATTGMLAYKYGQDSAFATRLIVFSTLCSFPILCIWSVILL